MSTVIGGSDGECTQLLRSLIGNAHGYLKVLMGNALGMSMVIGGVDGECPGDAYGYWRC